VYSNWKSDALQEQWLVASGEKEEAGVRCQARGIQDAIFKIQELTGTKLTATCHAGYFPVF
jgi:hypothetical protein